MKKIITIKRDEHGNWLARADFTAGRFVQTAYYGPATADEVAQGLANRNPDYIVAVNKN